ncbi:MAG TPA: protein phosphatase 2C domain-containing protein [Candidatus Obscuribacterales bacterium]
MKVVCNTLWLPKKGNSDEEYEDAAAPIESVTGEMQSFRCAVADGATETSFSRLWARLLVDGFVEGTDRNELKARWQDQVSGKQLAWYAEEKMQSGAFAALVCLTLKAGDGKNGGTWEVEALGDSCLILIRQSEFIEKFPLTRSDEFNSSPVLLSSNANDPVADETMLKRSGNWQPGDVFYLLTDAIARWTYRRQEEYGDAAFYLQSMKKQKDIVEFAKVQRELIDSESRPLMRNDDVTLMRVVVD